MVTGIFYRIASEPARAAELAVDGGEETREQNSRKSF